MLMMLLLFQAAWAGTSVWATADVDALRWPDATAVSMKVQKGDELELLVTDGTKLRVRKGTDFGWVDAASTSPNAPVADAVPALPPGMIQLGGAAPAAGAPPESPPVTPTP